jgi:phage baseplate assembly protein W
MSKMEGISVKVPLVYGSRAGPYQLNTDIGEVVRQNLKNLVLTNPGERVMIPEFGVGLHRLLFDNNSPELRETMVGRIYSQVNRWMPFVELMSVNFDTYESNSRLGLNEMQVVIEFSLGSLNQKDTLQISLVNN